MLLHISNSEKTLGQTQMIYEKVQLLKQKQKENIEDLEN